MRCHKCYYNNPKGANFCARCSMPLVQIKEGERRQVAIMFADISGFSQLARTLDPEVLRDTIDNAFAEFIGIIHKYEGMVDKVIGDCIMAVFGIPKSYEDTPLRSVMAAIEIREKFREIATTSKELSSANISIGINYGLVVTGASGKASAHTVMGDTVVLAERLQRAAPPGKIYVSESIYTNTNKEVEYQPIDNIRLIGRTKPVSVYIPLQIKAQASVRRLETIPMVGRKKELSILLNKLKSGIQGKSEIVSVIGEPGIGKSKLLFEFKNEVTRAYGTQVMLIEKRGIPYFKNSSYNALRGVIDEIIQKKGIAESKDSEFIKYFLSKELTDEERDKIESMDLHDRKEAIEQGLTKFIISISKELPLVFILDDAHLIDKESLRFFLKICRGEVTSPLPVFSIVSYRPMEGVGEFLGEIAHTKMLLEGLRDDEIISFIRLLLDCKKVDSSLVGFLLFKSGGNPFYIEELINSLLEQQKIELLEGVATCKGEIKVPDKISALIMSRIDKLDKDERELLELASVIKDNFTLTLLNMVASKELYKAFYRLRDKGYFVEGATEIYNFAHSLTKEAVYETILISRRAKLHKKVVLVIEEIYKDRLDEFLEPLAHHYQEAGEIEKAIAYSEMGGDHKRKLCLNEEAIRVYGDCINLILNSYKEKDRLFLLYEKLGETYESLGEYANAIQSYQDGAKYSRRDNDRARMLHKEARVFIQKGEYEKAYNVLNEAKELSELWSDEWGWIRIHQAQVEVIMANLLQAEQIATEVLEKVKTKELIAEALKVMAIACEYQAKGKEAFLHREKALKLLKLAGDKQKLRASFDLLDKLYSESADERLRRRWIELNFGLWNNYTGKPRVAKDAMELGDFYYSRKNFQKAIAHYKKSLEIWRAIENNAGVCTALFFLGNAYQKAGMSDEALASYNECLNILEKTGRKINLPEVKATQN